MDRTLYIKKLYNAIQTTVFIQEKLEKNTKKQQDYPVHSKWTILLIRSIKNKHKL